MSTDSLQPSSTNEALCLTESGVRFSVDSPDQVDGFSRVKQDEHGLRLQDSALLLLRFGSGPELVRADSRHYSRDVGRFSICVPECPCVLVSSCPRRLVKRPQSWPADCSNFRVRISPRTVKMPGCDSPRPFYPESIAADLSEPNIPECISQQQQATMTNGK